MLAKLAIITTHPIQYNAPVFKLLTERKNVSIKVFYTWSQAKGTIYDRNFKQNITWDVPLLEGYSYTFVKNVAKIPGSHHFMGIDNPTLIQELKEYSPNAILVYGWCFKSHLKVMRHYKGTIPILFRGDSTLLDDNGKIIKSVFRKLLLTIIYRHIDLALYVGANNKAYFDNAGLTEKQLLFSPHAIDNERFSKGIVPASKSDAITRHSLGLSEKDIVFLFAGKLESKKDPCLLLKSFLRLQNEHTHLIIVGNGALEYKLKEMASGHNRIHCLNFQNQTVMPTVYRLADIFVLPSAGPGETWGLAVNEAMACGKAVLISDRCGCAKDLVTDGFNGYVFKARNEEDLVHHMNLIASMSRVDLENLGRNSLRRIQSWSFDNICKSIENAVNLVLK